MNVASIASNSSRFPVSETKIFKNKQHSRSAAKWCAVTTINSNAHNSFCNIIQIRSRIQTEFIRSYWKSQVLCVQFPSINSEFWMSWKKEGEKKMKKSTKNVATLFHNSIENLLRSQIFDHLTKNKPSTRPGMYVYAKSA